MAFIERAAFKRHNEISQIIELVRENYPKDDDMLTDKMVRALEKENQEYKETVGAVERMTKQLETLRNMLKYFSSLQKEGLLQVKIELASAEGMRRFVKKQKDFAALTGNVPHKQFIRITQELKTHQDRLEELNKNSLIARFQRAIS